MGRAHLTAVASAVAFGLATAIIAAQAPGQPAAGQAPANPPPAPADPTLAQGQGRGGSPIQAARAAIKGANGITGTATLYEIANSANGHMVQIVLNLQNAPPGMHGVHIHGTGRCEGPDFKSAGGHFDPRSRAASSSSSVQMDHSAGLQPCHSRRINDAEITSFDVRVHGRGKRVRRF